MKVLKAEVRAGRLVLDVPSDLPEGTVLELVVVDQGDELDEDERAALHDAIDEGAADARAGKGRSADDVIKDLRARDR
jgi:hypothetical protein